MRNSWRGYTFIAQVKLVSTGRRRRRRRRRCIISQKTKRLRVTWNAISRRRLRRRRRLDVVFTRAGVTGRNVGLGCCG